MTDIAFKALKLMILVPVIMLFMLGGPIFFILAILVSDSFEEAWDHAVEIITIPIKEVFN